MSVKLSPVFNDAQLDSSGNPYVGAQLFTYASGSTTKQTAYQDSAGLTQHTNPIVLNARGEPPAPIWLTEGSTYKLYLTTPTDTDPPVTSVRVIDNVRGVNDTTVTIDEWVTSGLTPTYVSATSFTLAGDQTTEFHEGRRLKITDAGGSKYCTITSSTYVPSTTTIVLAGDALASPTSAVSYSIVRANNPSISSEMINRKGTAVASAATCDIWNTQGDILHITGSTGPITSFGTAPYAGAEKTLIFDSTPTITHNSTSLQCPSAQSFTAAAGDRMVVRADTTTNMIVMQAERSLGMGAATLRSYLAGLTLSTAGGSATMSVAAGQATDSTNVVLMTLAAAISKTTSSFAVGSGNGGLDTGAIANSTWYHFYEILRSDTGVVDVLFSLSASAPTMPSGYTHKRRIGSGLTNGSAQWVSFTQDGDYFRWTAGPTLDVNTTNPGTSAVTATLGSVPTGVNVHAMLNFTGIRGTGVDPVAYVSDLAATDEAPGSTNTPLNNFSLDGAGVGSFSGAQMSIRTNTSAQIRYRLSASAADTIVRIVAVGWLDRRGRDA